MNKTARVIFISLSFVFLVTGCGGEGGSEQGNYTVLDAANYHQRIKEARSGIQSLITALQTGSFQHTDARVAFIAQQLADIPYLAKGGMGEGDWQPGSLVYQPGATHVKQDPLYRIDDLDCQTLVQMTMGLLYSTNLAEFDKTILNVSYGAAGNPDRDIVRY